MPQKGDRSKRRRPRKGFPHRIVGYVDRSSQELVAKAAEQVGEISTFSSKGRGRIAPKAYCEPLAETRETEPWETNRGQIPVIEQAIETAALMLGTDKSRSYCLEMICADFLAGANLDNGNPEILLHSVSRFFKFLPRAQKQGFFGMRESEGIENTVRVNQPHLRLDPDSYKHLHG